MGLTLEYRIHLDKIVIEGNCTRNTDPQGREYFESYPVKIVSMRGIDYEELEGLPLTSKEDVETLRKVFNGVRTGHELDSISIFPSDGIALHYGIYEYDTGDATTDDNAVVDDEIILGPWMNRGLEIDFEVERGDTIIPDRYCFQCGFNPDTQKLYSVLTLYREGITYRMHYEESDGYVHIVEERL